MVAIKHVDKRQQTWLETVLDTMPVAASCSTLDDQKIIFVNQQFTELFGYEFGEHKTVKEWIEKTYVNPRQAEKSAQVWSKYFETASIVPIKFGQVEIDIRCKDGMVKTTLLSGVVLPSENWGLAIFADITDRKEREKLIQQQAMEDDLTGLPNRRAFNETLKRYLSRSRRQNKTTGLLLIDLDGFKELNDSRGHQAGDAALKIIADRLRRSIRMEDFVARVGGDEFAVIIDSMDTTYTTTEVAERILAGIHDEPIIVEERKVPLDVSIGIGIYPVHARDADKLYNVADEALYRAKGKGRGCWSR